MLSESGKTKETEMKFQNTFSIYLILQLFKLLQIWTNVSFSRYL